MKLQFTLTNVKSSLIRGIDYFNGVLTLDLGNALYCYEVPAQVALDLVSADSAGKYYNENIRNEYDYRELR